MKLADAQAEGEDSKKTNQQLPSNFSPDPFRSTIRCEIFARSCLHFAFCKQRNMRVHSGELSLGGAEANISGDDRKV